MYIWYGNWTGNSATTILTDFANNIGGSAYYAINESYSNAAGTHISNAIHYAGSSNDSYSQGTALTQISIESIVSAKIDAGAFPNDPNGVYFVLTSPDVTESGFCHGDCAYHSLMTHGGQLIKYAFVGDAATQCPTTCLPVANRTSSPNGNVGADGMVSPLAHELEETVTDPYITAWYDADGEENGDKCAWTFGAESVDADGARSNVTLGTRRFEIQQNWNASTQACGLSR
jgi:hypothetical protein